MAWSPESVRTCTVRTVQYTGMKLLVCSGTISIVSHALFAGTTTPNLSARLVYQTHIILIYRIMYESGEP